MQQNYINAVSYSTTRCILSRISDLFVREAETETGRGQHYLVDVLDGGRGCGDDGYRLISIVCRAHDIPILDMRTQSSKPIREMIKTILETSPPRCAILLDVRDNERMQKVCTRIAGKSCDLRYRRVIFCFTDTERHTGQTESCLRVPGSIDDRMAMVLYHLPDRIVQQAESMACFRPLAESMTDYTLFAPRVWREVCVDGTLAQFLSTALYQIHRHVQSDPGVGSGDYPSFEVDWRRSLATRLRGTLSKPPVALCPRIHRVIPVGVSSADAIQSLQLAIPPDIQDPYAVTVQSSAIDDRCGSIAITQPMRYTVIHINCLVNPGILVDVCRELRTGHQAIVAEVHSIRKELSTMREETNQKLSIMTTLVIRLMQGTLATDIDTDNIDVAGDPVRCTKTGCHHLVTKRFRSGKRQKQCSSCLSHVVKSITKGKLKSVLS